MERVPDGFAEAVETVLFRPSGAGDLPKQRDRIIDLIDAVESIVDPAGSA
jgi:hypothetical protein